MPWLFSMPLVHHHPLWNHGESQLEHFWALVQEHLWMSWSPGNHPQLCYVGRGCSSKTRRLYHEFPSVGFFMYLEDDIFVMSIAELAEGNSEAAQQRMEEIICLAVASLNALTYLPVQSIECVASKKQVAKQLAEVFCKESLAQVTSDFMLMMIHPSTCASILKVGSLLSVHPSKIICISTLIQAIFHLNLPAHCISLPLGLLHVLSAKSTTVWDDLCWPCPRVYFDHSSRSNRDRRHGT